MTASARQTFWDSFETGHECSLCDPVIIDQASPAADRQRQVAAARAAHYSRIARNARKAAAGARAGKVPDAAL